MYRVLTDRVVIVIAVPASVVESIAPVHCDEIFHSAWPALSYRCDTTSRASQSLGYEVAAHAPTAQHVAWTLLHLLGPRTVTEETRSRTKTHLYRVWKAGRCQANDIRGHLVQTGLAFRSNMDGGAAGR